MPAHSRHRQSANALASTAYQHESRRARRDAERRRATSTRPAAVAGQRATRKRWAPVAALALAGTLFGTYALPAYAVVPGERQQIATARPGELQTVTVAATEPAPVTREGVAVTPPPPKPKPKPKATVTTPNSVLRTANTFTNDPASPIQWPFDVGVPISDGFGYRVAPCSGCSSYHEGIDMNPGAGTPIQAIADGVVREVGNPSGSLGVYAIIDHQIDGQTVSSLYAHMAYGSLALRVGQTVKVRQLVGLVGSTGASTGAHLHLGISVDGTPIDPYAWLTQKVK